MVDRDDWRAGAHLRSTNGEGCCRRIACESEGYESVNAGDTADPGPFYEELESVNGIGGGKASESIHGDGSSGYSYHIGNYEVGESMAKDCGTETWSKSGFGVFLFLSPGCAPQYDDACLSFLHHLLDPASCSSSCPSYPSRCAK